MLWDLQVNTTNPWDPSQWYNVTMMEGLLVGAKPVLFCALCVLPPLISPDPTLAGGFSFDVTAGDIDFDMASELVITWIQNGKVLVQVRRLHSLPLFPNLIIQKYRYLNTGSSTTMGYGFKR